MHMRLRAFHVEVPGIERAVSFPHMGSPLLFARSTGLKVWPGAVALAALMANADEMSEAVRVMGHVMGKEVTWQGWRDMHVVEIGCGLALLSITAHRLGSAVVVATDGDKDLVAIAKKNLACNSEEGNGALMAHFLSWDDALATKECLQLCKGRVDLVVLSDAVS